jgi:hypothetical protein
MEAAEYEQNLCALSCVHAGHLQPAVFSRCCMDARTAAALHRTLVLYRVYSCKAYLKATAAARAEKQTIPWAPAYWTPERATLALHEPDIPDDDSCGCSISTSCVHEAVQAQHVGELLRRTCGGCCCSRVLMCCGPCAGCCVFLQAEADHGPWPPDGTFLTPFNRCSDLHLCIRRFTYRLQDTVRMYVCDGGICAAHGVVLQQHVIFQVGVGRGLPCHF